MVDRPDPTRVIHEPSPIDPLSGRRLPRPPAAHRIPQDVKGVDDLPWWDGWEAPWWALRVGDVLVGACLGLVAAPALGLAAHAILR